VKAARFTADALDLSVAWQEWQAAQEARLRAFRILSLEARLPLARETEDDLLAALKAGPGGLENAATRPPAG